MLWNDTISLPMYYSLLPPQTQVLDSKFVFFADVPSCPPLRIGVAPLSIGEFSAVGESAWIATLFSLENIEFPGRSWVVFWWWCVGVGWWWVSVLKDGGREV